MFLLRNKKKLSLNYPQYPILSRALFFNSNKCPCSSYISPTPIIHETNSHISISKSADVVNSYNLKATYLISLVTRQIFILAKQPKHLDLSYKTDLDLWDCLGRVKLI